MTTTLVLLLFVCFPISVSRVSLLSEPDMSDLHNFVVARIPHRWRSFGTQLGIPQNILKTIAMENSTTKDCFREVLNEWEKKGTEFTWKKVIEILNSPALQETTVANELCQKWLYQVVCHDP